MLWGIRRCKKGRVGEVVSLESQVIGLARIEKASQSSCVRP